jgi:hypothetical protein
MSFRPTPAKFSDCGRRKGGRAGWTGVTLPVVPVAALGGSDAVVTSRGRTGLAAALARWRSLFEPLAFTVAAGGTVVFFFLLIDARS